MADRSSLPPPSKATSYILNYNLARENKALHLELEGMKDANKTCGEEIQALREEVNATFSVQQQALDSTVTAAEERHGAEIQALRDEIKEAREALQDLDSTVTAADEMRGAEIQALRDEMKAALEAHSQDLARAFKENDGKRGVENQLLRSGMEALQSRYEETSERVRALENNAKQGSLSAGATNRPRKKARVAIPATSSPDPITLTGEGYPQPKSRPQPAVPAISNPVPTTRTGEGAPHPKPHPQPATPASSNPAPIIQAIEGALQSKPQPQTVVSASSKPVPIMQFGEGAPQSKPHPRTASPGPSNPDPPKQAVKGALQPKPQPQAAPCATPSPEMDTSATIFTATPIVPVPAPHFHNGHIHQGTMTLQDYTAAYAHHLSSIRAADAGESVDVAGLAEREAIVKFIRGMRENRDRRRITEDLETAGLAAIDRSGKGVGVKYLCGWAVIEEVLGGWEKRGSGEKMEGRM